jgi:acyl-homoserine lactone acylase PvdQ
MPLTSATQPLPLSQATVAPWIIPSRLGFIQNSQSATQNWVFGSSSGPPGMVLGAGYPVPSQSTYGGSYYPQEGHLQVPGTQYSQFQ